MIKVKFCGLSQKEDIMAANRLMPDYVGFVFADFSKRSVDVKTAAKLKSMLNSKIQGVGVFVNENLQTIAKIASNNVVDVIQLHGDEDEEYIKKLKTLCKKPIIQAFQINGEADIKSANDSKADFILLDSGQGAGVEFDWSLAKKIKRPYFLAGGLSSKNIEKAISELNPFAVDVSSGIETNGKKDEDKMKKFIKIVRDISQN